MSACDKCGRTMLCGWDTGVICNGCRLQEAPLGTLAPSCIGGGWVRVEHGWQAIGGDTFPAPGGDWSGRLVPPNEGYHRMTPGERLIMASALGKWGDVSQWRKLQEECGECIAAVNQVSLGRKTLDELAEEVAGVEILVMQAKLMLGERYRYAFNRQLAKLQAHLDRAETGGGQ